MLHGEIFLRSPLNRSGGGFSLLKRLRGDSPLIPPPVSALGGTYMYINHALNAPRFPPPGKYNEADERIKAAIPPLLHDKKSLNFLPHPKKESA